IIKKSKEPDDALNQLISQYNLSLVQAKEILNMRLRRLARMEHQKLLDEQANLIKSIERFEEIINSKELRIQIIKDECLEIKEKYKDLLARKTEIEYSDPDTKITEEDLISESDVILIITKDGYIKRMPITTYETQRRGGKGKRAMKTRPGDYIRDIFIASTHDFLLVLTTRGKLYWTKVYKIPEGSRESRGKPIQTLISLKPHELISTVVRTREFSSDEYLIIATKKGLIKKSKLSLFRNIRESGIKAISLRKTDEIVAAKITTGEYEIVLGTKFGMACRFSESDVRPTGRDTIGVRGINLKENDEVVAMVTVENEADKTLLTVTKKGYGKRTRFEDYRKIKRGGRGVKNIDTKLRNDEVIYMRSVSESDELMLVTLKGNMVRIPVSSFRVSGRSAAGHIVMRFKDDDDEVVGVGLVE
ncbi:MAG: DNA gyrase C-terminal beta-propeller domain-containing protein, partial [Promethearchaeota archaeon]